MERMGPGDWWRVRPVGDGVTWIDEPHVREFYRCNVWHVRGRDRDMLVDSGMGVVSLRDWVPMVTERLKPLQAVQVQLDALPNRPFEAKVLAVDPLLDANGRSIAVRAAMPPASDNVLRPGMFARVLIVFSVNERALVVPEEALVPQAGKQYAYVLDEQGEGDAKKRLSRRVEVALGARRGSEVEVVSGLRQGETVVIAGQQRLQRDGTAVRVVNMAAPAATEAAPAPAR